VSGSGWRMCLRRGCAREGTAGGILGVRLVGVGGCWVATGGCTGRRDVDFALGFQDGSTRSGNICGWFLGLADRRTWTVGWHIMEDDENGTGELN